MTNSDNKYGTHNKKTYILSQVDDGSTALTNHESVDAAKGFFFSVAAIDVFDECCTELQWAVVDNTKLKYTMAFGTKGTPGISSADDWAGQFNSRQLALENANGWGTAHFTTAESDDHLF